ncbi:HTH-type transcriptional regulator CdhR [compost metagenome]|jgi:Transcriptional regulator containing an amidase domain and an AraC-type DNA-binding HTH domain|uniref:GlxA family transcriptional regulator n=1 Tax=Pseudomonas TaxID=286 RepID=UPI0004D9EFB0|nr:MULTISPECIES: GlxA family transcriptional regulator [Pseudomonas]KEY88180.1 AraC family transcriptional regulator [Pseudomonas capeferrum]KGI90476.1 AraC family transcriptional regulator [Pseudomonas sp. H2]MCH7302487.1 GlxA family transcriptional regulator [Pseudomonas capeferrum]MDD2066634.1 GlxA family transcriptional regulator [Pseudomonas sp. 25571]UDU83617.1 GlxA family transcriptional regulator [Pseudomonas sp. HN2-3]
MKSLSTGFSATFADRNLQYTRPGGTSPTLSKVGFLLLDNFSLPCFTQALDVLVTANVIRPGSIRMHTFSHNHAEVMSDLSIPIRPDTPLTDIRLADLDLIIICGGLRSPRTVPAWINTLLLKLANLPITLGGLWNGAWYLGRAGLLDGYRCAIHPEQRLALSEGSPHASVTLDSLVLDRDRVTAATPAGAFQMMIKWLEKCAGRTLADAVIDLLDYDQSRIRSIETTHTKKLTGRLRELVKLMEANLEDPLDPVQLSRCVGLSRRQMERLFQGQLSTTPQKYYLELRITEARRLIQNSKSSLMDVALACGFVSSSHFSRNYSRLFGYPPSKELRYEL